MTSPLAEVESPDALLSPNGEYPDWPPNHFRSEPIGALSSDITKGSFFLENFDGDLHVALKMYKDLAPNSSAQRSLISHVKSAGTLTSGGTMVALELLLIHVKSHPKDESAWWFLVDIYSQIGDFEATVFSLEELLLICPHDYAVHLRLGETFLSKNNFPAARIHLKSSLYLNPASTLASRLLSEFFT